MGSRSRQAAERWVADQLRMAEPAFAEQAEGLAYASLEEYERSLRARAEHVLRSVRPYRGLTLGQAEALAAELGDELCVHRQEPRGHRMSWSSARVHVTVGPGDVVRDATLDPPPW